MPAPNMTGKNNKIKMLIKFVAPDIFMQYSPLSNRCKDRQDYNVDNQGQNGVIIEYI
jgi:hypothetical protein